MEYSLNAGEWNKVFAVPSSIVDNYIKLASGNSLKLMLYLLRHGGETITEQRLKNDLGFDEFSELEDAALFWVQRGIIRADSTDDKLELSADSNQSQKTDRQITDTDSPDTASVNKPNIKQAKPVVISNGEIAQELQNSPEMKMLFSEAEKMFSRPLKNSERQMIIQLSTHYGLPCEVSLMLLRYCFKIGKATPQYISKVAENWVNEEIMTVKLADEKIRSLEKQSAVESSICEALGLSSALSASNRTFIKTWAIDWGFSNEMIMIAYNKTIDAIGSWNFKYANKILENWKNNGITTPQAVEKSDNEYKNATNTKNQTSSKRPVTTTSGKSSSFDTERLKSRIMSNYKNSD